MRVLIGTIEKANMIHLHANAFRAIGHEVITVATPHPFYDATYTHSLHSPPYLFHPVKSRNFWPLESARWRLAERREKQLRLAMYMKYKDQIDLFLVMGDGFFNNETKDFEYLRKRGAKVVQLFYGGDARCWNAFHQEYKVDISTMTEQPIDNSNFNSILTRLRKAELFSNQIYSLPDQMGLAIRPYSKITVPFEFEKYQFNITNRAVPKIVHIESRQPYKGEEFIYSAIEKLKMEGLPFEFRSYKNLAHSEVRHVLEDADILVDEVMIFGPGSLGNEAIACGCALATKMQPDHIIARNVCNLSEHNILEPLRRFILNRETRVRDLKICRELLEQHNSPREVAIQIVDALKCSSNRKVTDYSPSFFLQHYELPIGHVVSQRNKNLTRQVLNLYPISTKEMSSLEKRGLI